MMTRQQQIQVKVRKHPGVMANRLTEIQRQLAHEDLSEIRRMSLQDAAERLVQAFASEIRCRCCGRHLTAEGSRSLGVGPECARNGPAA
jgi:hypothetical protein